MAKSHLEEARAKLKALSLAAAEMADAVDAANRARQRVAELQVAISKDLDKAGAGE